MVLHGLRNRANLWIPASGAVSAVARIQALVRVSRVLCVMRDTELEKRDSAPRSRRSVKLLCEYLGSVY